MAGLRRTLQHCMEQLHLRQWQDTDLSAYAEMNSDPEVMRYFPAVLSEAESAASLNRLRRGIAERGWGVWAVEVDGVFAGMAGLSQVSFTAPFTPCVEILWRFRREFWGRSLAYRAAQEALAFGFRSLQLSEIVAFTAVPNTRSQRLMQRLGLRHNPDEDFDHPYIADGHGLRRHVLYRIGAAM
jgi:RimJ/RimL family protein N-acetyltransferase